MIEWILGLLAGISMFTAPVSTVPEAAKIAARMGEPGAAIGDLGYGACDAWGYMASGNPEIVSVGDYTVLICTVGRENL